MSTNENKSYQFKISLIQPWSVPVLKTTLPPEILQSMIEISDQVLADKHAKNYGPYLAGQIEKELFIDGHRPSLDALKHNILEKAGVMNFFLGAVRQFVIQCKIQSMPGRLDQIRQEDYTTQLLNCWVVSQQPGEYNPMHVHTACDISSVMYLKIPKMMPSRKKYHPNNDGNIFFTNNSARDVKLSSPSISIPPQVGDFYIFGAQQQHGVYPYRCEEGQEDVERRSISFNAVFQSKADYDREKKKI